jgi:hypothetical protein
LTGVKTLTAVAVGLTLLVTASPAVAQTELPVGEAEGVRVVRERGAIVVIFTARAEKLYKRIAGKLVRVSCSERRESDGPGLTHISTGEVTLRAPSRRGKLRTGDKTRGIDYCRVWLPPRTATRHGERIRLPKQLVVSVPLSQGGAVFLDEEEKAADLLGALVLAALLADKQKLDVYPTHAQLVDAYPRLGNHIVALANPTDSPPAGVVGYYTDGQEHLVVAVMSASGRRLFVEQAADNVLSTNVGGYIFGEPM